jgi:hypothetical protein
LTPPGYLMGHKKTVLKHLQALYMVKEVPKIHLDEIITEIIGPT